MKNLDKKRIIVLGSSGQLGSDLVLGLKKTGAVVFPITHTELEITNTSELLKIITPLNPEVIINTIAYHKVDEVETNPEKAFSVNASANYHLAHFCRTKKCRFIYMSTGYVFGGDIKHNVAYSENDCPAPINMYGISKLAGELIIKSTMKDFLIIRTSGLYGSCGSSQKGTNFVERMIAKAREDRSLSIVDDQIISPTSTIELSHQIIMLLSSPITGIVNATSDGACSWYEFTQTIFKLCGIDTLVTPVKSAQLKTVANRPLYNVLSLDRLKQTGLCCMSTWQNALQYYLRQRNYLR